MAIQATNQIKVGDHVRLRNEDEYLGKVVDEKIVRFLTIQDNKGNKYTAVEDILVVAQRLTPEGAWAELPYLILAELNKRLVNFTYTSEYQLKQIRHECYKLLGGAGIKVTEPVKERVRKAIKRLSDAMGIELA